MLWRPDWVVWMYDDDSKVLSISARYACTVFKVSSILEAKSGRLVWLRGSYGCARDFYFTE